MYWRLRNAPRRRLAAWGEEGLARQYDDLASKQDRGKILARYARSENWSSLLEVIQIRSMETNYRESYAVDAFLVRFLVRRRGKQTLVRFASEAQCIGWQPVLREYYGIQHQAELETM